MFLRLSLLPAADQVIIGQCEEWDTAGKKEKMAAGTGEQAVCAPLL